MAERVSRAFGGRLVARSGPAAASAAASMAEHPHSYRADIDGLRAIAVLAVLLFHMRVRSLCGGFVGVDVFFVISGYLICQFIAARVDAGQFDLAGFYARRIRRILPAYLAMVTVVVVLASMLLLPAEAVSAAKFAVFGIFSLSNVYLYQHANYFRPEAATYPLLHSWSLSVEEQFYLLFPVLIIVLSRSGARRRSMLLAGLALLSFGWSCYGGLRHTTGAFYLLQSRAWELLTGALIAVSPGLGQLARPVREMLGLAGLAAILASFHLLDLETPFPGPGAALPCLGTACVIAAGVANPTFSSKLLGIKPLRAIGLVSYSLYLWHWPIIFFQVTTPFLPGAAIVGDRIAVTVYAFAAAILSWRFIERPCRRGFPDAAFSKMFAAAGLGIGGVAALAIAVIALGGFPGRYPPQALAYASTIDSDLAHFREGSCFISVPYTFADFDRAQCLNGQPGKPDVLLLGDSHAAQLWYGLHRLLPEMNVLQATAAACPPFVSGTGTGSNVCDSLMAFVFQRFLPHQKIGRVLLAARWRRENLPDIAATLRWAAQQGIAVTLFGPAVEYTAPLPRLAADQARNPSLDWIGSHRKLDFALDADLRALAAANGARYVSFIEVLCRNEDCAYKDSKNQLLLFDSDHFTKAGSVFFVQHALSRHALL